MSIQLLLGVQKSEPGTFWSDGRFAHWPGVYDYGRAQRGDSNCLALLVCTWSCITITTLGGDPAGLGNVSCPAERPYRILVPPGSMER